LSGVEGDYVKGDCLVLGVVALKSRMGREFAEAPSMGKFYPVSRVVTLTGAKVASFSSRSSPQPGHAPQDGHTLCFASKFRRVR